MGALTSERDVVALIVKAVSTLLPGYSLFIASDHSHVRVTRVHEYWIEGGVSFSVVRASGTFYVSCVVRPLFVPEPLYLGAELPGPGWLGGLRRKWRVTEDPERVAARLRRMLEDDPPACLHGPSDPLEFATAAPIVEEDPVRDWDVLGEAVAYAYLLAGRIPECIRLLGLIALADPDHGVEPDVQARSKAMLEAVRSDLGTAHERLHLWRAKAVAELAALPVL